MLTISPQFITDSMGEKISVIIPIKEYEALMEELEDMEDERLYEEGIKNDTGERILLSDYLKEREMKNA